MQRILITGAAGDVGSRLTALLRDTYQLRLSDIRTRRRRCLLVGDWYQGGAFCSAEYDGDGPEWH